MTMEAPAKRIAVLGATGSVGEQALEVIAASEGRLKASILSAHRKLERLVKLAEVHRPQAIIATDRSYAADFAWPDALQADVRLGHDALAEAIRQEPCDIVLAAIMGSAGLKSTWAAVDAGKTIALANKETLVMAGPLVMERAQQTGAMLLPVDSEHSGIFQALNGVPKDDIKKVTLTASGGPFREWPAEALARVTVEEALNHPTWEMGPKITIDSATMMNKALEVIEARWLFSLDPDSIEVVIHPQSIVHAMVEFVNGSTLAQLSPPDMRLPIQVALEYPERHAAVAKSVDWSSRQRLDFAPADFDRFPALRLGFEAARSGGTSGAVLNAANEAAVANFLSGELHFTEIVPACESVLQNHHFSPRPTLDELIELDRWAREEVERWKCT